MLIDICCQCIIVSDSSPDIILSDHLCQGRLARLEEEAGDDNSVVRLRLERFIVTRTDSDHC